ncbi:MAG: prepilin-type N-terminal cleavage/methylation domain-containing protein [Deltaproteobacteria bacterium]|nr:prepilin-type N-terminal cleavage/methylation domain-containing protein [Deltaproteobacteria bacterium]
MTRAFTLLEILVALVLLSLLIAVAVPAAGALSGAELRSQSGMLTGAVRDTYARTALIGRSARLVMDLEQDAWWIEEAPTVARLHAGKQSADRDGKAKLDPLDERIEDIDADTDDEKELAKLELLSPPPFKPVEGEDGQPHKLPADVHFKSIWAEHLDDKQSAGQVALYFFPGGFTEEALITLTDDEQGERTLTLVVSSLTGEVDVVDEEPRVPELVED